MKHYGEWCNVKIINIGVLTVTLQHHTTPLLIIFQAHFLNIFLFTEGWKQTSDKHHKKKRKRKKKRKSYL